MFPWSSPWMLQESWNQDPRLYTQPSTSSLCPMVIGKDEITRVGFDEREPSKPISPGGLQSVAGGGLFASQYISS